MEHTNTKLIKEIAENLEIGCNSYYNKKTYELIAIPNNSLIMDDESFDETFGEDFKRVTKKNSVFIKIDVLESFDSFKIMEYFTEQLEDNILKQALLSALERKKPFQNFNHIIHNSNKRQNWFDFKQKEMGKIVEKILDIERL